MGMRAARFDYHVHESHSGDAREATIPLYIKAAESNGVEEVCFTTHLITQGPDVRLSIQDDEVEGYIESILSLNETTDVVLKPGLEVDYIPGDQRKVEHIIDEYNWDFIMGSVHLVGDWDVGSRRRSPGFFEGRQLVESTHDYYTLYTEAIETGLFDMMSHPDYWRRYQHLARSEPARWEEYSDACHESIDALKSHGMGVEVNTSGRRHEHGVQYPIKEFLDAVNRAGIRKVTIGSDSHVPETLGYWLVEAVEMLKDVGFDYVTSFDGRKAVLNPIDSVVRTVKNL
jgi:histidinol-phosphatase (PHP family)